MSPIRADPLRFADEKRSSRMRSEGLTCRRCRAGSAALVEQASDVQFLPMMILLADRGTTMRTGLITAALTLIPAAAFAHTGAEEPYGFVSGFAHPLGGLDHIL